MRRSTKWMLLGGSAGAAAGLATIYGLAVRPWHLSWGATPEELRRPMPFDDEVADPNYFSTRAITIEAPVDEVWPFITDPAGLPHGTTIRHREEKSCIVLAPPDVEAEATWVVVLEPIDGNRTRIISRSRARFPKNALSIMRYMLTDPGQFVIERNWLLRVKERAEVLRETIATSLAEEVHAEAE